MRLVFTKHFVKQYKKLNPESQNKISNALEKMKGDLTHKSLRVKKMKGYHNPNIWEASANMYLRITFELVKPNTLILRNCGEHDKTLNRP